MVEVIIKNILKHMVDISQRQPFDNSDICDSVIVLEKIRLVFAQIV